MRLDHLLSREPVNWGRILAGVFRFVCVSCACIKTLPAWVVGVGAFEGWAFKRGKHAVGFTFNTCWAVSPQLVVLDVLSGVGGCVVCCL